MRSHVLLKPGDMAISCYDGGTSKFVFVWPLLRAFVSKSTPQPQDTLLQLSECSGISHNLTALKQNLLGSKWVGPAAETLLVL